MTGADGRSWNSARAGLPGFRRAPGAGPVHRVGLLPYDRARYDRGSRAVAKLGIAVRIDAYVSIQYELTMQDRGERI